MLYVDVENRSLCRSMKYDVVSWRKKIRKSDIDKIREMSEARYAVFSRTIESRYPLRSLAFRGCSSVPQCFDVGSVKCLRA